MTLFVVGPGRVTFRQEGNLCTAGPGVPRRAGPRGLDSRPHVQVVDLDEEAAMIRTRTSRAIEAVGGTTVANVGRNYRGMAIATPW
jgi:hypothetical protein